MKPIIVGYNTDCLKGLCLETNPVFKMSKFILMNKGSVLWVLATAIKCASNRFLSFLMFEKQ